MKPKPKIEPLVSVLVRIPEDTKRELERIAHAGGESLNTVIREAIRRFLRGGQL